MSELIIAAGGAQPYVGGFGDQGSRFFGQEFIALDPILGDLTFRVDLTGQAGPVALRVLVVSLSANDKVDQTLFTSSTLTVTPLAGESLTYSAAALRSFTVDLGDTSVVANQRYGIVWQYMPVNSSDGQLTFEANSGGAYAGGDMGATNGADLSSLQFNSGTVDIAMKLTFAGAANSAPVAPDIADRVSFEDVAVNFQVAAFTDPNGDTLSYSATMANGAQLPGWLSFDAATRTFSGTPPTNYNGVLALKVTATDGLLTASDTFNLTITPVNDAPVAPVLADRSSAEDTPVSFQVTAFTDAEGGPLTYSASLADGDPLPGWLNFDAATRTFSGTPPANFTGVIALKVTATDALAGASDTFDLTITPANDGPVAPALSDRTTFEDVPVNFQVTAFVDVDGDTLTYSATLGDGTPLPAWLSFDAATRTFSGTPPANYSGVLALKVTASDGLASASDTFDLTIAAMNDAPAAPVLTDKTFAEDGAVSFQIAAFTDADGDTLTYSATLADGNALPGWLLFDAGARTFTGTPPANFNGLLSIRVTATDGIAGAFDTFDLTIAPVNDAPVAAALVDQTSAEDAPVSFAVAAFSDIDGDALTYTATLENGAALPAWLSFDGATRAFTGTPPANFNGVIALKVTASDGTLSASDVFNLTITPANDAPTAPGLADRTSAEDAPVNVQVAAFSDVDGDTLAYSASLGDGTALPGWLSFDAATRTFSGTPPVNFNGVLALKVTATDGALSATDTFDLTITPVNDAPTAAGDAISVAEDATSGNLVATLLANDTDPDASDTKTITAVGTGSTKGTVAFNAGSQTLTYSADHEDFDLLGVFGNPNTATDTFTYTMMDSGGLTSTATVTVTITGVADGVKVNGGAAAQVHQGGDGEDTIFGLAGHDSIYGLGGSDSLNGGSGNDIVDGGTGHDRLLGDTGDDRMYGGSGRDTLWGDSGNDTIDGGAGDDVLTSGSGYDVFAFGAEQSGDRDVVTDFSGVDKVRLDDGLTLASAVSTADVTGDGARDTVLTLSDGHVVVLAGYTGWSPGALVLG
ncbi:putative Ig domain-containing protein [Phenylobacterium sp.]|jgi:Ca2+-binding RTX toxin-like protein|uniref:putative Ig domain-containing protein n=1 Tax=Phenylobacterium sp. TaxID=1871053 RepID=UPI002E366B9A|nr:putative Ig domain-containing protein [Phenylobacterium sp.]HEX2558919.1 putative Ig domain-containing protein [Phenylobacterium sp.]